MILNKGNVKRTFVSLVVLTIALISSAMISYFIFNNIKLLFIFLTIAFYSFYFVVLYLVKKQIPTFIISFIYIILLTIFALINVFSIELLLGPIVSVWVFQIAFVVHYYTSKRIINYFSNQYLRDLQQHFINPIVSNQEKETFQIKEHPYIDGIYEEGWIQNRLHATYKGYDFEFYEYHLEHPNYSWDGSILVLDHVQHEDYIFSEKVKTDQPNDKVQTAINELRYSFGKTMWIQKDRSLSIYIKHFTPISDAQKGYLKNPVDYVSTLLADVTKEINKF